MTSMRALILPSSDNTMPPSEGEKQIAANFAVLVDNKRRKVVDENLALETACLVDQEVRRWQNSIRELEAMLGDDQGGNANRPVAPHPIPAIVAMDDTDSDNVNTPAEGEERASDGA